MKSIKSSFKEHKYLYHSISLFMVLLFVIGFRADGVIDFFVKLGKVLIEALALGIGLYLLQMISGWLLYPFIPKHEDFSNDKERFSYFGYERENKDLLILLIYLIIAVVIALDLTI